MVRFLEEIKNSALPSPNFIWNKVDIRSIIAPSVMEIGSQLRSPISDFSALNNAFLRRRLNPPSSRAGIVLRQFDSIV